MKTITIKLLISSILLFNFSLAQDISPSNVKDIMQKVADWQIENHGDVKFRAQNKRLKSTRHHPLHWTNGALYVGMVKWAAMAEDDKYFNWLKDIAEKHDWKLHTRTYHADDHTVGQMYIDLYREFKDEKMIQPTIDQFDFILYHPSKSVMDWKTPFHQDRWNWCDALFMSPPVWAKLYNLTQNQAYLDFMIQEFNATTEYLYDKKESLYYRDGSYLGKLDKGTKIFWSRGNGWVFAGLANVLNELKSGTFEYNHILKIYKQMAEKLLKLQTPAGHWSMSLLGQQYYPTPETSGSSFYVFGFAWGINNGILDKLTYGSAVEKGWNAMVGHVTEDGMLGYVQPIGAEPGQAWPDKTEVYGTGAFLSAGSEVYKLYSEL